jgi:Transglycosylase SLT domain/SPOR domain
MPQRWRFIVALILLPIYAPGAAAQARPAASDVTPPRASADQPPDPRESMCLMIESAARANHLPLEFFARVIWQESRFQTDVIGPPTRSGERAQGIAQFMPRTAVERRLLDPFDPVQALPKSAEFLRELRDQFGNLGLAAAAYNAGPQRVRDWMKGARLLPDQTRHYVLAITGTSVDEWAKGAKGEPGQPGTPNCRQLMALLRRAPNPFVEKLQERINLVGATPWGIQLSAGFSRDRALAAYAAAAKRYGEVLAGRDPSILSTTLQRPGTPTFYQVRVGAETREDANRLCAKIQRVGGACLVLRNFRGAS